MTDTMKIEAIEEIRALRARFARSMDTKNWSVLRGCIAEDCHFDCTQEAGIKEPWVGAEAILGNIRRSFATAITVHHAHTAEIEILSPTSARGLWAMQDLLRFPGYMTVDLVGYGHYHEEYSKVSGRWQLSRYRLTRLRVDVTHTAPPGASPPPPPRASHADRTIRAVQVHTYGGPEVLVLEEVAEPVPGPGEVLLRIAGAAVNPVDIKARAGDFGLFMPLAFPAQLGGDISGTVEAVGEGVSTFAPGDRVMGMINPMAEGGYAEKVVAYAGQLAHVPVTLDLGDAAAIPMGSLTGCQLVEQGLKPSKGDRILVTGAGGSVGRAAIYAAADIGCEIVAGVRAGSESAVAGLPLYAVVDINDLASVEALGPFDGVADTVGGLAAERLARFVKHGGIMASVVSPPPVPDEEHGVVVVPVWVDFQPERLTRFAEGVARGDYSIPVAERIPLAEAARAHAQLERGGTRGKLVLMPEL
jgi:NADPH2:quinone reductase